ncbi:MAG: N-acetylmuramoyl-L-alanine amidase [Chitinophagaceae bacterium]
MRARLILPFLLLIHVSLFAQYESETRLVYMQLGESKEDWPALEIATNFDLKNKEMLQATKPVVLVFAPQAVKLNHIEPFLSFSMAWSETNDDAENTSIAIRFSTDGKRWKPWTPITKDEHYEKTKYDFVSTLMEFDSGERFYQLKIESNLSNKGKIIDSVLLNFFSPGTTPSLPNKSNTISPIHQHKNEPITESQNCSCPLPVFVNRAGWNSPQQSWNPSSTAVTHLIVHHSAGSNTSTNWAAVVLSIWNFHTGTNGYSDIGYNWLIAPDGTLFEGRFKSSTDDITGAHFCGFNGGTMGVCMLGTFTNETITDAARNTLIRLLAWKSCQRNIDPTASAFHSSSNLQLNLISGHRQGCSTECPGTSLFNTLPAMRTAVKQFNESGCTLTAVSNLSIATHFSLTPNPVRDEAVMRLSLPTPEKVEYRLMHLNGRELYRSAGEIWSGQIQHSIRATASLPPGIYLLQVQIGNRSFTERIIKQ